MFWTEIMMLRAIKMGENIARKAFRGRVKQKVAMGHKLNMTQQCVVLASNWERY